MDEKTKAIPTSRTKRIIAGTLDSFLSGILGCIALGITSGKLPQDVADQLTQRIQEKPSDAELLALLNELPSLTHMITAGIIAMLVYYIPELLTPYSFGKYLVRIKIVSSDATPSSFVQRLVRFVVKQVPLIALAMIAFDPKNMLLVYSAVSTLTFAGMALIFLPEQMALYDYVAKTRVVDSQAKVD